MTAGGTLNLNGGTTTLSADTTYTYLLVTDTSGGHNGTLVMGAGTVLQFDDTAGAGFASAATAITITIVGTATNKAQIKSAETLPHNAWTMPAVTTTMTATRCRFKGFSGAQSAAAWTFTNCDFGEDTYCSVQDVRDITNASATGLMAVSNAQIERFIADAVSEIDDRTNKTWSEQTATDEIYEWDGSPILKLRNYPVISITTLYYRDGSSTYELMTSGAEEDYYLSEDNKRTGFVELLQSPYYPIQAVKVTYQYGVTAVPYKVRKLCAKMAAVPTFEAMQGAGHKSIYADRIAALEKQVDSLLAELGSDIEVYVSPPPSYDASRRWPY
jgi:hypothetical protein